MCVCACVSEDIALAVAGCDLREDTKTRRREAPLRVHVRSKALGIQDIRAFAGLQGFREKSPGIASTLRRAHKRHFCPPACKSSESEPASI